MDFLNELRVSKICLKMFGLAKINGDALLSLRYPGICVTMSEA